MFPFDYSNEHEDSLVKADQCQNANKSPFLKESDKFGIPQNNEAIDVFMNEIHYSFLNLKEKMSKEKGLIE